MQPVSPLQRQKPSGLGPSQNHRCGPGFREPAARQVHFEVLESRCLLNADLVISELLASNLEGHLDFFDNDSDWIEIHNRGTSRALLDGWRITDDLDDLEKWQFPVGTFVEPDQRLLVYASDRDLVTSTGELHTNFRLDPDGEPLALVSPNGVVSDGISPAFPPQATNVSYGIQDNLLQTSLVTPESSAFALVPLDGTLGTRWTGDQEPFDTSAWTEGSNGVGYETEQDTGEAVVPFAYWTFDHLDYGGTVVRDEQGPYDGKVHDATLTSGNAGRFGEALVFDGDNDYVNLGVVSELVNPNAFSLSLWFQRTVDHAGTATETNHSVNNVLIGHSSPTSNDTLEIGTEGNAVEVYLDTDEFGGAIPPIRQDAAIQNGTWHHLVVTYDSNDLLETKIYVDGILVNESAEYGGLISHSGASPLSIGLSRPDSNTWGDFEGLVDDLAIWDTAVGATQVASLFSGTSPLLLSGYGPHIGMDVTADMFQNNSSVYLRVPFTVSDPNRVDILQLDMHYDDAFVAYINGTEVTRSNFSGTATWNSIADTDRTDSAAITAEEFFIPAVPGLLQEGENILSIQSLNQSASSVRSLALPILDGVELLYPDVVLVSQQSVGVALVPSDGSLDNHWTGDSEPFDDSDWTEGPLGVGYDLASEEAPLSPAEIATVLGGPAPLAYWTFDDLVEDGSLAPDEQGNYDGTVVGAVATSHHAGRFGAALSLDGDDDYLSAGVIPELANPAAFSVSLWFQRTVNHTGPTQATNHSVNNVLIANSSSSDNDTLEIGTEDGFIEFYFDTDELGGDTSPVREEIGVQNGVWHHLVFTYDSQESLESKIYLDGALVHEDSQYGGLVSATSNPLTIGLARADTSRIGDFEGLIDDVAIWDAALSSEQVAALSPVPAPLMYWTFDTLSGDRALAPDIQSHYDGTVIGATPTTSGQGRFGEALVFDGDDDSVSAGVVTEMVRPAAFSASIWFQRTVDHAGTDADTNHQVNNLLIAHSSDTSNDTLEIGTEEDFIEIYLDSDQLGGPIPPTRIKAGIQNGVWHHLVVTYDSLQTEELKLYLDGALVSSLSHYGGFISDSATSPLSVGAARPTTASLGDFEGLIDEVAFWDASLNAEHVTALFTGTPPPMVTGTGYSSLVGIDLEDRLVDKSHSAYLRVPFQVTDPTAILALNLDMKFDDAFVAYINGTEVARSNFSGIPQWNSPADTDRSDRDGFQPEQFVISKPTEFLQAGNNLFTVHGMNAAPNAARFVMAPKLSATMKPGQYRSFMKTPTPGELNAAGSTRLVPPPVFSVPGKTFSDEIIVELTNSLPETEFRYTTNGSLPTASSTLYTGPIAVSTTTQIRAMALYAEYIPSEINTETYIQLGSDLTDYDDSGQPFRTQVPLVIFDTFGQSINDSAFQNISFSLFEPTNGMASITDTATVTSRAGLKIRGSSSASFAKKPFALELRHDFSDADMNQVLLGMPAESDWVLQGPYQFDRSLNRNRIIYELSNQVGRPAMRSEYIEVFVNQNGGALTYNDYAGIYVLIEKIKRDPNRIDVEKLSTQMSTEPDITGGYILKIDRLDPFDTGFRAGGQTWAYVEPKETNIEKSPQQKTYISNYVDDFISALNSGEFIHPTTGEHYTEFVDLGATIDHHLLNELMLNVDALRLSAYWHKQRGGLLRPGPVWDFDRSAESADSRDNNPTLWYMNVEAVPGIWSRFFDDLEFRQAYIDRWTELRRAELSDDNIQETIDRLASQLGTDNPQTAEPDAVTRNFERWSTVSPRHSGPFASGQLDGTWHGEVEHQKAWLSARTAHFDGSFLAPPLFDIESEIITTPAAALHMTGPPGATLYYTLDGTDPRLPGGTVSPAAIPFSAPIEISELTTVTARAFDASYQFAIRSFNHASNNGAAWSGIRRGTFTVGSLSVTEINYHPAAPTSAELSVNSEWDDNDFEFLEIELLGQKPLDLNGVRFIDGIDFDFTESNITSISPGERLLIIRNQAAFEARYGTGFNHLIAGQYAGGLSNGGENLTIVNALGQVLQNFSYDDDSAWSKFSDGVGSSLEVVDPSSSLDNAANWRASTENHGTPGTVGIGPLDTVVVNEVLTNTNAPHVDAVELYNPTDADIDVGGWWFSDALDQLDRYTIPSPMIVSAHGYKVFDKSQFGFGLNSVDGDQIVLVQPNAMDIPEYFITYVPFGPALEGESFGRWPNGTGEFYPMKTTTLGAENSGPRVGPVVISEIMFHPQDSENGTNQSNLEFLEIYNPLAQPVDLANAQINGLAFDFPTGTIIDPGQVIVIVPFDPVHNTTAMATFEKQYQTVTTADETPYLGPYIGRLDNNGETLTLLRTTDPPVDDPTKIIFVIEDQVQYDNVAPWPTGPDGAGLSLQRIRVDLWGNDPHSWEAGQPTPGRLGRNIHAVPATLTSVIGEVGKVVDLTHETQTIMLSHEYVNPVVFAQPPSYAGEDPVVVRVQAIQPTQFDIFLAEPSNLNGFHNVGETVSYLVLEEGSHWLRDGTHLEVGRVDTAAIVGTNIPAPAWKTIHLGSSFVNDPVTFSQVQTTVGELFLTTRHQDSPAGTISVALEPEEQFAMEHPVETIGYLAIESGEHTWNGMPIYVRNGTFVSTYFRSFSLVSARNGYSGNWDGVPAFFSSLSTYYGFDNSHLRFQDLEARRVSLKLEEDTTFDEEMQHTTEQVSVLAIGGEGPLTAVANPLTADQSHRLPLDTTTSGTVLDVNVYVELIHPNTSELDISLQSPDGGIVELMGEADTSGDNFSAIIFDDEAATAITSGTAPLNGEFQPTGSLRNFVGTDIAGTWTLIVTDHESNQYTGALMDWSLRIEIAPEPGGNLNYDSHLDAADIDLLFAQLGGDNLSFDLDGDGNIGQPDIRHLVRNLMGKQFGDADLDQKIDLSDYQVALAHWDPLGENQYNGWTKGDFDGDTDVDFRDIMRIATHFAPLGYSLSGDQSTIVTANSSHHPATPPVKMAFVAQSQEIDRALTEPWLDGSTPFDSSLSPDKYHSNLKYLSEESVYPIVDHTPATRRRIADPWKQEADS